MWGNFRLQTKNNFCLCFRSLSGIGHIHGRDCWVTCRGGLYEKKEKNYKHLWGQSSLVNMWWEFELSPNKSGDGKEESLTEWRTKSQFFEKYTDLSPAPFSHNIFKSQQSKKSEWNMYIYQNFPQQKKTAGLTTLLCVVALFFWSAHKVFANSVLLCHYNI